jgi:hypothetical protein
MRIHENSHVSNLNIILLLKKISMKKIYFLSALLVSLAFTSCKKEDNSSNNNPSSSFTTTLTSGSWKVSYFHHDDDNSTANFSSYVFTFSSNGTMTATNNSGTTNGTWSKDDSHNEVHFSIGSSSPLSDLSSGWTVISTSASQIIFKDDGNSAEELHLTKI